jgi:hypothetical protein
MTGTHDDQAGSGSARARFDAGAMTGRPAAEATEYYRARGFWVVVSDEADAIDLSFAPGRVRLFVRDGTVVAAQLG